jgi:Na+/melibiose symporter-like transporter
MLGRWIDKLNRRVVFVVGLSLVGCFGVTVLICKESLCAFFFGVGANAVSLDDGTTDDTVFGPAIIAVAFLSFGIADICYDCLLIPGRALLDDLAVPLQRSDEANAIFTGFQLVGRLVAMLVVSSNMTNAGFWGLYDIDDGDGHFKAVLSTNVLYLIGVVGIVLWGVKDVGARQVVVDDDSHARVDDEDVAEETENFITNDRDGITSIGDDNSIQHQQMKHSNKTKYQPLSIASEEESSSTNNTHSHHSLSICSYKLDATVLLVAVQAAGWTSITSQSFMWTAWRGEQIGSIDLALQGVVGILTSAILPRLNKCIGASTVWLASELLFHLLMMSVAFTHVDSIVPRIISALCGINYAIHATNGLTVAADVVADPSKRARTIAMVNNALPMGQLVTALFGGSIAQYFGGFQNVFVCFGGVGCVVTASVWIVSSKQGLF